MRVARRADRARVTGGGGEVGGDEEDENGELRDVDGGAAARDEAGAATVRSLGDMVSAGSISLMNSRTPLFSGRLHICVAHEYRKDTCGVRDAVRLAGELRLQLHLLLRRHPLSLAPAAAPTVVGVV